MGILGSLARGVRSLGEVRDLARPMMQAARDCARLERIASEVRASPLAAIERFEPALDDGVELATALAKRAAKPVRGVIALPGFASGDRLVVHRGSELLGHTDIAGSATIDALTPTSVALTIQGRIGNLPEATIGVNVDQLSRHWAEFSLRASTPMDGLIPASLREVRPLIAHIDASTGAALTVHAVGAPSAISVARIGRDQLTLTFAMGERVSRVVLAKA